MTKYLKKQTCPQLLQLLQAGEEDMSKDEAEELQELLDEIGLDVDEAHELWQEL